MRGARRPWSASGSPPTPSTCPTWRRTSPPRSRPPRARRTRWSGGSSTSGSPKQLQEILFTELGLPKTKKIKTGYTTDAEALQGLYAQTGHPVLGHLLRHRDVAKLKSTVDGLLKSVSDDGRIHTTFFQTVAATGRLSSTDPNLQNVPDPHRGGPADPARRSWSGRGTSTLLTADYSQIEMRIMAHLSRDAALIEAFGSGFDFHAATASSVFAVPVDRSAADQRRRIKAMNYGLAYGLSSYGLSQQLGITPAEATVLMEEYFGRFGGVRDYLHAVVEQARRDGYTADRARPAAVPARSAQRQPAAAGDGRADGAQRPDPGLGRGHHQGGDAAGRRGAGRGAGCGPGCCCRSTTSWYSRWRPGEREPVEALVREQMGGAYPLDVPLAVSVGVRPGLAGRRTLTVGASPALRAGRG